MYYLNNGESLNNEINVILWEIKQRSCSISKNAVDFLVPKYIK
jgi:hypothetical protein